MKQLEILIFNSAACIEAVVSRLPLTFSVGISVGLIKILSTSPKDMTCGALSVTHDDSTILRHPRVVQWGYRHARTIEIRIYRSVTITVSVAAMSIVGKDRSCCH